MPDSWVGVRHLRKDGKSVYSFSILTVRVMACVRSSLPFFCRVNTFVPLKMIWVKSDCACCQTSRELRLEMRKH